MTIFPHFYQSHKVGDLYHPDVLTTIQAGRNARIAPANEDIQRTALLLVDMQVDFIHANGALSVPGAVDDTRRTIEWIYTHLSEITTIYASLDSHLPLQIFSPGWWINKHNQHPAPYTVITAEEVDQALWQPLYDAEWSKSYVYELEKTAKKQLMIWPYHTLTGTVGHNLMPALYEAIAYHSSARETQPELISKGSIPKSENYSIFEPEVKLNELPHGGLNISLLDKFASYDRVYIAGEAKSHCVLETVNTMMRYFKDQPEIIRRIHILEDCMSSVAHPEIDFETMAQAEFDTFVSKGLQLVQSV